MKSVERHNLQTNVVAHGLELAIERCKPYLSTIIGGLVALVAAILIWSYVSGTSAARRSSAWDAFNEAVSSQPMDLELLRRTAEEFPGTKVQQLADVTWADGQVLLASDRYIYNRGVAEDALSKAETAYRRVIQSSDNTRVLSRARLGLARVYEMQGELEKAGKEYEQVSGAYAKYAKAQGERLAAPEAKEAYDWLAKAEPPRPVAPTGPGTPGQKPQLFPNDLTLPNATTTPGTGDGSNAGEAFDALLKEMQKDKPADGKDDDRYKTDPAAPATDGTETDKDSSAEPPKGLVDSPAAGDSTKDEKQAK